MVSWLSIAFMFINMIIGILVPVLSVIFLRKKTHASLKPFVIGMAVMYVFAFTLEQIVHAGVLGSEIGAKISGTPILYALYGGFMAGLFEETGRYFAYSKLLKKQMDNPYNSVMYGLGHGGIEMIMILAVTSLNNIIYSFLINSGAIYELAKDIPEEEMEQLNYVISELVSVKSYIFMVSTLERLAAIILQIALSVIVFYAVKDAGKKWLYPVAILFHMLVDTSAAYANEIGAPVLVTELIVILITSGVSVFAFKLWKKNPIEYTYVPEVKKELTVKPTPIPKKRIRNIALGATGIVVPQNAFGALPIQRDSKEEAVRLLRMAFEGGMRFFDTARAYSDSEEKCGEAFEGIRDNIYIATKTAAKTPEEFWEQLETSLKLLKTDYIDIYQFHCANQVYKPGDGTGMYECMLEAKAQGKIRHIGITAHKIQVAKEAIESGLYETLQYPFSYLAADKEIELVKACKEKNMGFIAMKGLAGGLITNSRAAMAFISEYDNVLPIWGVQRENELLEWLSYMNDAPSLTGEIREFVEKEKKELSGEFCRGCGYCMPCPKGIMINQCARMSLMLRRAPSKGWLNEDMQKEMMKIEECIECRACVSKCPYSLDTPNLLKKNLQDYKKVLAGEITV